MFGNEFFVDDLQETTLTKFDEWEGGDVRREFSLQCSYRGRVSPVPTPQRSALPPSSRRRSRYSPPETFDSPIGRIPPILAGTDSRNPPRTPIAIPRPAPSASDTHSLLPSWNRAIDWLNDIAQSNLTSNVLSDFLTLANFVSQKRKNSLLLIMLPLQCRIIFRWGALERTRGTTSRFSSCATRIHQRPLPCLNRSFSYLGQGPSDTHHPPFFNRMNTPYIFKYVPQLKPNVPVDNFAAAFSRDHLKQSGAGDVRLAIRSVWFRRGKCSDPSDRQARRSACWT